MLDAVRREAKRRGLARQGVQDVDRVGHVQALSEPTRRGGVRAQEKPLSIVQRPHHPHRIFGNIGNNILSGGAGNDYLIGDSGNDTLLGGLGTDTMEGWDADDTYEVDSGSDVVTEFAAEGIDTILASVARPLDPNVENLTLTGTGTINGTGNSLANVIRGNSAINTLTGGQGNDSYYVSAGDTVVENANQGTDTIFADITWSIATIRERREADAHRERQHQRDAQQPCQHPDR